MTKAAELAKMGEVLTNSQIGGRRNVVINGGFQCWQRETSITASGFSADRWRSTTGLNGAMTISRQEFTAGQTDVPSNPKYFFRHAQTTAFTNTGYNSDRTRIEDVRTLAGQLCTLTWYMKADASRTVRVNITQDFGTGGSPSSDVETAIVSSQAITTSFVEYTVTFTMPSINGKTIGSNEDSFIELGFDYRAEVNNTFTIDIANVQLEAGQATPFEHRSFGEELMLCKRYCNVIAPINDEAFTFGHARSSTTAVGTIRLHPVMRGTPTLAFSGVTEFQVQHANSATQTSGMAAGELSTEGVTLNATVGSGLTTGQGIEIREHTTGATVTIDAEL